MRISDWISGVCSSDLIDDCRLYGADAGVGEAETLHHARREVVSDHVALFHKPQHDVLGPRVLQIEREAALARIAVGKIAASIHTLDAVLERRGEDRKSTSLKSSA